MPEEITPTALRKNLYRILDEIIESGSPLDITRKGHKLRIVPVNKQSGLHRLEAHPGTISGDPEDLVHMDWSDHWEPRL